MAQENAQRADEQQPEESTKGGRTQTPVEKFQEGPFQVAIWQNLWVANS